MFAQSIIALFLFSASIVCQARELVFSSKATGFPSLNYSAIEISNTETTSSVSIPGFANRSAAASRWMMCVYTNLALIRHKQYWTAVYPQHGDTVLVGFPDSASADELSKLGAEFVGNTALKQVLAVGKMEGFCRSAGYKFKYLQ
jgi:hypothetical protein